MQIRSEPFFLLTTAIWLTQSVGSFIGVITPLSTRLSSSVLTLSRIAIGNLRQGNNTLGFVDTSTHKEALPKSPKLSLRTEAIKVSQFTVTRFIDLTASRPKRHWKLFTTRNCIVHTSFVLGLTTSSVVSPAIFTVDLFHIVRERELGLTCFLCTNRLQIVLTWAPVSIWNLTSQLFTDSIAVNRSRSCSDLLTVCRYSSVDEVEFSSFWTTWHVFYILLESDCDLHIFRSFSQKLDNIIYPFCDYAPQTDNQSLSTLYSYYVAHTLLFLGKACHELTLCALCFHSGPASASLELAMCQTNGKAGLLWSMIVDF